MPSGYLWERVVDEYGLTERRGGWFSSTTAQGTLGGIPVWLKRSRDAETRATVITLAGNLGTHDHVTLHDAGGEGPSAPTWETGDSAFDRAILASGDPVHIQAALDARVRALILALRVRARYGKLWATCSASAFELHEVFALLNDLPLLVEALRLRPPAYASRLEHNAVFDPVPQVRLRSLLSWQSLPSTSHSAVVEQVIKGLLTDSTVATDTRKQALASALRLGLPRDAKLEFAAYAFANTDPGLVTEGARALGALGATEFIGALCAVDASDLTILEGVADALGSLGGPAAEARLIALLSRGGTRLRCHVAKALGQCGTLRAVEALLPLGAGIFDSSDLRTEARAAVAAIQARAGPADAGRVSLASSATTDGALSDAGAAGAVSTTRHEND